MLVQANSGAGKSWTLRRILEQTAAGVQQLVIDPEGEFASLREKFDYIVCAPHDADAVATPQTAAALARALWESGTSRHPGHLRAQGPRARPVRAPLPRGADQRAEEGVAPHAGGDRRNPDVRAAGGQRREPAAVIDLASRGRKRGLALVGATQRLSKLHKDVAAELLNKIIMRTGLDVDVQRAADELGMARAGAAQTCASSSPARRSCSARPSRAAWSARASGPVVTSHPKTGQRGMVAPPPASKAVLAKLAKLRRPAARGRARGQDRRGGCVALDAGRQGARSRTTRPRRRRWRTCTRPGWRSSPGRRRPSWRR
jgi:hypothetical protein